MIDAHSPFPLIWVTEGDHEAGIVFGMFALACVWILIESLVLLRSNHR